MINKISRRQNV